MRFKMGPTRAHTHMSCEPVKLGAKLWLAHCSAALAVEQQSQKTMRLMHPHAAHARQAACPDSLRSHSGTRRSSVWPWALGGHHNTTYSSGAVHHLGLGFCCPLLTQPASSRPSIDGRSPLSLGRRQPSNKGLAQQPGSVPLTPHTLPTYFNFATSHQ